MTEQDYKQLVDTICETPSILMLDYDDFPEYDDVLSVINFSFYPGKKIDLSEYEDIFEHVTGITLFMDGSDSLTIKDISDLVDQIQEHTREDIEIIYGSAVNDVLSEADIYLVMY
jgi:hypothetical protein